MLLGLGVTLALYVGSGLMSRLVPAGWRGVLGQLAVLVADLVALTLLAQRQHGLGLRRLLIGAMLGLVLGQFVVTLWRDRATLLSTLGLSRR